MAHIPLTNSDEMVLVDDGLMFELLSKSNWVLNEYGYAVLEGHITLSMHRFINATPKGMWTDHVNGKKLDNRRENLRTATPGQNRANVRTKGSKTSQYQGVSLASDKKRNKPWIAYVSNNRIGRFATELEAAIARDKLAIETFGEFATLNFPQK